MSDRQAWWLGFLGTIALAIAFALCVFLLVSDADAQPAQGFGPTFDPTNLALRVNVVAGAAGGLSPTSFGTAFPNGGAAVGGKDPNGAFASLTISSSGRLQVTCDNCSSSAASFGTAFPSSGGAIGYKDSLGAFASVTGSNGGLNVNVLSGGGGSATYGTAFPSSGATGFKDALGAYASVTLSNGLPVNVVQGAATDAPYGTAAPTAGLPVGFKDANGAFASVTSANGMPVHLDPGSSVIVSSSALPVGASTELTLQAVNSSVQNVEVAIRETTAVWDTAPPIGGVYFATKDSGSGLTASLNSTNGRLQVTCDNCSSSNGTFGAAFPATGSPAGFKDASGAFASVTSTTGLPVNIVAGAATDAPYGTAAPSSGLPIGYKDALGAFASITGSNGGMNVNVLSGGGGSSTFGTAFPSSGVAAGYKDANGAFASFTGSNGKQNVIVGNESTLVATANQGASAVIANAWPIVNVSDGGVMVRAGDDVNKALRVNVVAGGTSNSTFGTAFPSTGIAAGYKDTNGAFASFSGSNGKLNVIVGNESTLIATVTGSVTVSGTVTANQGASAVIANAWPIVQLDDAGSPVRAGDATNKALRVNVVAGGTTGATFGTAFPTTGSPAGYRDPSGAFASFTGINGAGGSIRYDSAGRELGSSIRGKQSIPDIVQLAPQLPSNTITLGARQTTIVNVPSGQPAGVPLRGVSPGGGLGTQGWVVPQIQCDQQASISLSNSGLTQIVPAVNGKTIYVCGAQYGSGGTTPFALSWTDGTGNNCDTGSNELTGAIAFAASGGLVNSMSPIPMLTTRPGMALCARLSNSAPVGGHLRYTQF